MDNMTPNKTPIKTDTKDKLKRSYKVDTREKHVWLDLYDGEKQFASVTVDTYENGITLGGLWVAHGTYRHGSTFFDCNTGLMFF